MKRRNDDDESSLPEARRNAKPAPSGTNSCDQGHQKLMRGDSQPWPGGRESDEDGPNIRRISNRRGSSY
jgi:hypothetical protein